MFYPKITHHATQMFPVNSIQDQGLLPHHMKRILHDVNKNISYQWWSVNYLVQYTLHWTVHIKFRFGKQIHWMFKFGQINVIIYTHGNLLQNTWSSWPVGSYT